MHLPNEKDAQPFLDNLFRRETRKLASVLTQTFSARNLELPEDVMQDTLLKLLHVGSTAFIQNPIAWLFAAARNKALDVAMKGNS